MFVDVWYHLNSNRSLYSKVGLYLKWDFKARLVLYESIRKELERNYSLYKKKIIRGSKEGPLPSGCGRCGRVDKVVDGAYEVMLIGIKVQMKEKINDVVKESLAALFDV